MLTSEMPDSSNYVSSLVPLHFPSPVPEFVTNKGASLKAAPISKRGSGKPATLDQWTKTRKKEERETSGNPQLSDRTALSAIFLLEGALE